MKLILSRTLLLPLMILASAANAFAAGVNLKLHDPFNLFETGAPVQLEAELKGFPDGSGEAVVVLKNYFSETDTRTVSVQVEGTMSEQTLDIGELEPGYYEVEVAVAVKGVDGKEERAKSDRVSIGVVTFTDRTAKEAREQGSRFGLKLFQVGKPGVWWKKGVIWDLDQAVRASAKLGLQWNRHGLRSLRSDETQPGTMGLLDLVQKHPMNVIMKIEGISEESYDEQRYGPLDKFKENHKGKAKHNWSRTTVPKKGPYQAELRKQIAAIPEDQNVFEIGNEVWNYMSGTEFAEWSQMVVPVVKEMRPDALIGGDHGSVSRPKFTEEFLSAGGLEGWNAIFIHPYTFKPEPETRTRMELRNESDYLHRRTGKQYDFYVTEYGWPSVPPEHQHKVSQSVPEPVQAQRTVRQSLMLYAEDMKTLIPHMMADREEVQDDWDDWFGFFRIDGQPRPVIVAHAVSARMIDSSRYAGEFRYGPGIGAMLFERDGVFTLALWCTEAKGNAKINVEAGVPELTMVDLMGRQKKVTTQDGKLPVDLSPSAIYLVGVSPDMEAESIGRDVELDPDQWWTRPGTHALPRLTSAAFIDGDVKEWAGLAPVVGKADASDEEPKVWLAWDEKNLYIAADVKDERVNVQEKISASDALRVDIGAKPARQTDMQKKALYDYVIYLQPTNGGKAASFRVQNAVWVDDVTGSSSQSGKSGIGVASKQVDGGWTVEAAIPLSVLEGFPKPAAGERISGSISVYDSDGKDAKRKLLIGNKKIPAEWPYLELAP